MIDLAREYVALLYTPYPECQSSIEREVDQNSPERSNLGLIPSQFVVGIKGYGGDYDSSVAQY